MGAIEPAFEITLVHGTWGRGVFFKTRDAPWTRGSSGLCTRLETRLGGGVRWHRYAWTGRNSHEARTAAALKLRAELKERIARNATAKHVVIAHSHGGNVALMAIDDELRGTLHGVACLATPFIVASKRDWGVDEASLAAGALITAIGVVFGLAYWLLPPTLAPVARFMIGIAAAMLLAYVLTSLLSRIEPFTNQLLALLGDRRPVPKNLLILRSPADEAGIAISLFIALSHLTIRIFRVIQGFERAWTHIVESVERRRSLVFGFMALAAVGFFLYIPLFIYIQDRPSLAWLGNVGLGLVVALCALAGITAVAAVIGAEPLETYALVPVGAILLPCLIVVSVLTLIPFGWRAAAANLLLTVSAETAPWGSHRICFIRPPHHRETHRDTVESSHSIHSNPQAYEVLADWLRES
jgi:hypothetical protein